MASLVLQPTDKAQWHALVNEAEAACHAQLDETLEAYLVLMLMRFTVRTEMVGKVMAMEFLEASANPQSYDQLRDVGDQCLIFSGLFPQLAEKRLVRVSYFVRLGRSAYDQLASVVNREAEQLYSQLAEAFVGMMDVLQAMRGLSGETVLQPLAAAELWADTGSRQAFRTLRKASAATPGRVLRRPQ